MASKRLNSDGAAGASTRFQAGYDPRRGRGPRKGAPNAGARPDYIRALARQGLVQVLPRIIAIALDPDTPPRDVLRAGQVLTNVGLPAQLEIEDVASERRPTYDELLARIAERLPRLIAILPLERRELARLFSERQEIDRLIAERTGPIAAAGEATE